MVCPPALQFQSANNGKRKLEADLQQMTQDHEELVGSMRASNDKAKKAMCEVWLYLMGRVLFGYPSMIPLDSKG